MENLPRWAAEFGKLVRGIWKNFPRKTVVPTDIALHGNPISELRDVTCHMGSHSVTCHPTQVNAPCLTPAMQAGTRLTYPRGMEGWVDLVDLIAPQPGVEPATFSITSLTPNRCFTKTVCPNMSRLPLCLFSKVASTSRLSFSSVPSYDSFTATF